MSRDDAAGAAFWDERYRQAFMPWDAGGTPTALHDFLAVETRPLSVLVPGCGSAYEVATFAAAGHRVVAVDFSEAAVARAREALGDLADRVKLADFFTDDCGAPFDVVYERAFLCALPPALWRPYAERVAALLVAHGRLAGFFFGDLGAVPPASAAVFPDRRGPPFPLAAGELDALLAGRFARVADHAPRDSLPVFAGRERWQVWRRND
jgi:SAM-dependent methyltransferase